MGWRRGREREEQMSENKGERGRKTVKMWGRYITGGVEE